MSTHSFEVYIKVCVLSHCMTWWEAIRDNFWSLLNTHIPSHVWTECSTSAHVKQSLLHHITHSDRCQSHTFSLYMGFFIVNTENLQYVCSVTNNILCRTNDVFLYSFSWYNQMNSMNIWWFFLKKKNRYTLTVNSCTSFFPSPISVCRNCLRSCCKWCFTDKLRSGAVVVWLCVQLQPSPEWSVWLEDSGGSWLELNKDFFGSCLLAAVTVSFLISAEFKERFVLKHTLKVQK